MSSKSASVTPVSVDGKDDKEMVRIELTKPFHKKSDIEVDSPDHDFQPIKIASPTINDSIIEIPKASISRIFITNDREGVLKSSPTSVFSIPNNKTKNVKIIYSNPSSAFTKTKKGGRKLRKNKSRRKKQIRKTPKRK